MIYKNLTPHCLNVITRLGMLTIDPSGVVARCNQIDTPVTDVGQIEIFTTSYGDVIGLPDAEEGTRLIVSALVRQALPNRKDLFSPGQLVRDEKGQPVGCKGLYSN